MDYNSIEQLIQKVSDSKLTLFEIESDGLRLKMEKKVEQVVLEKPYEVSNTVAAHDVEPQIYQQPKSQNSTQNLEEQLSVSDAKAVEESSNEFIVKSPIVGTFYITPSADAPNFVKVGSKVKKGDVLCIIEAMKLMNEIESEVDGEIIQIFGENEQMVEYGQQLFKIKL